MFKIILLQGDPAGAGYSQFILLGAMFLVMYLFFIRPQQKRRKEAEAFRASVKKGDKIVTIGGIHGKIAQVKDNTVVINTEGGKLEIEKSAISPSSGVNQQEVEINK